MKKLTTKISSFSKKSPLIAAAFFFILGIGSWLGFNGFMDATNTLEFCISCHEMEATVYQDYKHSAHFTNASGVRAECSDCHVPKQWGPKVIRKIQASIEVYHWLAGTIDTPEKFDLKRKELASRVWKTMESTDSRECRGCHQFSVMELENQARFAQRIHGDASSNGDTCIDCHKGLTHRLPKPEVVVLDVEAEERMQQDMEYGEEINETCAACHGEFAEGSMDGEYPRLAGLDADYLAQQLRHFKTRARLNIPMIPYTSERELPDEDIDIIASYLSKIKLPTKLAAIEEGTEFDALERLEASEKVANVPRYPGHIESGQRFYQKECAGCHGDKGEGKQASYDTKKIIPPLTGQFSIYLLRQMTNFKNAERLHDDPRDAEIFKLYSAADLDNMLAYLSILDDG